MDTALSFLLLLAFATVSIKGAMFTVFLGDQSFETDEIYFTTNNLGKIKLGFGEPGKKNADKIKTCLAKGKVTEIKIQVNFISNCVNFESVSGIEVIHHKKDDYEYYDLEFNYSSLPPNLEDNKTAPDDFKNALHDLLDYFRDKHSAGKLKMDERFSVKAQKYADNEQQTASSNGYQLYENKYVAVLAPRGSIAAAYVAHFWYEGSLKYFFDFNVTALNERGLGLAVNPTYYCYSFAVIIWYRRRKLGIGLHYGTDESPQGSVETLRAVQCHVPDIIHWQHDALNANVLKARDNVS